MSSLKDYTSRLLDDAIAELHKELDVLREAQSRTHPKPPKLRVPKRYITRTLVIVPNLDTATYYKVYHKVDHVTRTYLSDSYAWRNILLDECDTPRKLVRVLARIESLSAWCRARVEGLSRADQHLLQSQQKYIEKLEGRIAMIELREDG